MARERGKLFTDPSLDAEIGDVQAATADANAAAAAANAQLTAIADAGSDAELHAQSVAPFTDSNAVGFDNGAKGYAAEASASASTALGHSEDTETYRDEAAASAALATLRAAGLALATPITYIADNQTEVDAIPSPTNGQTLFRTDTGALYERAAGAWSFRIQVAEGTFTTAASLDGIPGGAGARVHVYQHGAGSTWDWQATNPLTGWTLAEDHLWVAASGSGFWVRRVEPGPVPMNAWGDDGADLNDAIAAVIATGLRREIALPASVAVTDTVHIFEDGTQSSVALVGQGPTFWGDDDFGGGRLQGTTLDFGSLTADRPGIAIQTGRNVRLEKMALKGPLDAYVTAWVGDVISHLFSDYVADMGGASVSRESPCAGVVIDPYTGPEPADPYPVTANYGQTGASVGTELDRVLVRGFPVGIVVHPVNHAGTDVNSSETEVRFTSFANGIAVSIGNTQAQNFSVKESHATYGFVAVSGVRHGRRLGPLPHVRGLNTFGVYRLFECTSGQGNVEISGVHAELMGEIGLFGLGVVSRPFSVHISDSDLAYYISDGTGSSISATPFYAKMPMAFTGVTHARVISDNDPAACVFNYAGDSPVSFRANSFLFADNQPIVLFVSPNARETKMEACHCASGTESKLVNTYSERFFPSSGSRRMYLAHWVRTLRNLSDGVEYRTSFPRPGHSGGCSNAYAVDTWNWGAATFRNTSTDGRRFFVGDIILLPCIIDSDPVDNPWASGNWELLPAARITAYDTGTRVVTFERLFHADAIDEAQTPTHIQYAIRQFAIDPAVTADFTSASAVVDLNLPAGNVSDYFAVGDEVTTADGTTLPNSFTRVLSINDGAGTMTLTHNAAATVSAQPIFNVRLTAV